MFRYALRETPARKKRWIGFFVRQSLNFKDYFIQRRTVISAEAMDIFGGGKYTDKNTACFRNYYFTI